MGSTARRARTSRRGDEAAFTSFWARRSRSRTARISSSWPRTATATPISAASSRPVACVVRKERASSPGVRSASGPKDSRLSGEARAASSLWIRILSSSHGVCARRSAIGSPFSSRVTAVRRRRGWKSASAAARGAIASPRPRRSRRSTTSANGARSKTSSPAFAMASRSARRAVGCSRTTSMPSGVRRNSPRSSPTIHSPWHGPMKWPSAATSPSPKSATATPRRRCRTGAPPPIGSGNSPSTEPWSATPTASPRTSASNSRRNWS